ncbi:hypothetical protein [Streptomyces sp. NPDC056061]|uniref:hypothetical protein n=1 Tax=Streptomyces sp. NPDC056061 TaxID=3345700 RepID=UPI0035D5A616
MSMPVSRTQWCCCLLAVLGVVLGLFCGPGMAARDGGARATAVAVASEGTDGTEKFGVVNGTDGTEKFGVADGTNGTDGTDGTGGISAADGFAEAGTARPDVSAADRTTAPYPVLAPVLATASDPHSVPGCGKSRKHEDGEPALPGRSRTAQDQAPGLAGWGPPAVTGPAPFHPPVRMEPRGQAAAARSLTELSVLRV